MTVDKEYLKQLDNEFGFVSVSNWIMEIPNLNSSDRLLLAIIKDFQKNGKYCSPSLNYLADKLNMTKRNVCNTIKKLESLNLIEISRVDRTSNKYSINKDTIQKIIDSLNDRLTHTLKSS